MVRARESTGVGTMDWLRLRGIPTRPVHLIPEISNIPVAIHAQPHIGRHGLVDPHLEPLSQLRHRFLCAVQQVGVFIEGQPRRDGVRGID